MTYYNVPEHVFDAGLESLWDSEKTNNAQFVIFTKTKDNNYHFYDLGHTVCHVGMQSVYYKVPKRHEILFTVSRGPDRIQKKFHDTAFQVYLPWLLNESPWADLFFEKDLNVIKKIGVPIGLDGPSNLVMGAHIAARHSWEFPAKMEDINCLVKEYGFDPSVAFMFRYQSFFTAKGNLLSASWDGHNSIHSNGDLQYYKNFYKKHHQHPNKNYLLERTYSRVNDLWEGRKVYANNYNKYCLFEVAYDYMLKLGSVKVNVKYPYINPWESQICTIAKTQNIREIDKKYLKEIGKELKRVLSL